MLFEVSSRGEALFLGYQDSVMFLHLLQETEDEAEFNMLNGLLLTFIAGMATMGGLLFIPVINSGITTEKKATSAALAFAAGVMIWLSFVDMLSHAAIEQFSSHYSEDDGSHSHGPEGVEGVLVRVWTLVFFFVGMGITVGVDTFVASVFGHTHTHSNPHSHGDHEHEAATAPQAIEMNLAEHSHSGDPHHGAEGEAGHKEDIDRDSLLRISMLTLIALALHNLPEGLAAFFSSSTGEWIVVIAIGMHNLPEGAAIAVPAYQSSKSYMKATVMTFIASLAQPLGGLIGYVFLVLLGLGRPTEFAYGAIFSITAGVMVAISLVSLIPEALGMSTPAFCMAWA